MLSKKTIKELKDNECILRTINNEENGEIEFVDVPYQYIDKLGGLEKAQEIFYKMNLGPALYPNKNGTWTYGVREIKLFI